MHESGKRAKRFIAREFVLRDPQRTALRTAVHAAMVVDEATPTRGDSARE
jgi:hypothetical protein